MTALERRRFVSDPERQVSFRVTAPERHVLSLIGEKRFVTAPERLFLCLIRRESFGDCSGECRLRRDSFCV